jgi:hypothetical protein
MRVGGRVTVPGPSGESPVWGGETDVKNEGSSGVLEKFCVHERSTYFTIVAFFFHSIFTSDPHALAVLPDIALFALDKEFACTFIIVTCKSRG